MTDFQVQMTVGDDPALAPGDVRPAPVSNVTVNPDGKTAVVTDAQGRTIKVRKLTALDRMRLFKLVGNDAADNGRYMGLAGLAACVTEISGGGVSFPSSLLQLEATVQRLDDEGLNAVAGALIEMNPKQGEVEDDARFLSSART